MKPISEHWLWLGVVILLLALAATLSIFLVSANMRPTAPTLQVPPTAVPKSASSPGAPTRPLTLTPALTVAPITATLPARVASPAPTQVGGASPTRPRTTTVVVPPSTPAPTACLPQITTFAADRATLARGESTVLRWGAIANAQRIELDNGIGVVAAPGTRAVAPTQTTTFTLTATCGSNRATKAVTITVNQPAAPTIAPATLPAGQRSVTGIWMSGKYILQLEMGACVGAECSVQGEFSEWSGTAAPVPGFANGTFNPATGALALKITAMPVPDKTFAGTLDASNTKLAGQLSGVGALTFAKQ